MEITFGVDLKNLDTNIKFDVYFFGDFPKSV